MFIIIFQKKKIESLKSLISFAIACNARNAYNALKLNGYLWNYEALKCLRKKAILEDDSGPLFFKLSVA